MSNVLPGETHVLEPGAPNPEVVYVASAEMCYEEADQLRVAMLAAGLDETKPFNVFSCVDEGDGLVAHGWVVRLMDAGDRIDHASWIPLHRSNGRIGRPLLFTEVFYDRYGHIDTRLPAYAIDPTNHTLACRGMWRIGAERKWRVSIEEIDEMRILANNAGETF